MIFAGAQAGGQGGEPAITLRDVCMCFKGEKALALDHITADIPYGAITGLVGPDAAGKTTLMRILAGLMLPTDGEVRIFGDTPENGAAQGIIGYMPQRFGLYEDLSVQANLALHARLRGVEGKKRDELFARLLHFMGLSPFTERLAGKLSGGMKQKLGIACSLLGAPRLLLLDEPGVGVDPQSRRELWKMVQELRDGGMTIIWSTAYLEEAERCPHVIMLDKGHTLHVGAPGLLTRTVQGRVFRLRPHGTDNTKRLLARWITTPGVEDALIQGRYVRIVIRADALQSLRASLEEQKAEPVPPRLEDAYMSALGGISQKPSPFAQMIRAENAAAEKSAAAHQTHTATRTEAVTHAQAAASHTETASATTAQAATEAATTASTQAGDSPPMQTAAPSTPSASVDPAASATPSTSGTDAPIRIEAKGLCKHFGTFIAAHDISFTVRAGQIFGLLGPNGAGKSTTFRMLCGLSTPTSGQCFVDGVNLLTAGSQARGRLGYMAQKFSLYVDISVAENINILADLYGLTSQQKKTRIPALVEALDLQEHLRHTTNSLPLGQKQRLALLCATLHNPPVLFLDEPTSGVDACTRRDFWKHITAMTRAGTAVLVTTHFMEEAEYCDSIALVYQGGIISAGTPDRLKKNAPRAFLPPPEDSGLTSEALSDTMLSKAIQAGTALPDATPNVTLEDAFIAYIAQYAREHPQ